MKYALALTALAVGCGSGSSSPTLVDSGLADGPMVYCSSQCGTVDASDGPNVIRCAAGQICGETGGVSGFICCAQGPSAICSPGNPAPGSPCH